MAISSSVCAQVSPMLSVPLAAAFLPAITSALRALSSSSRDFFNPKASAFFSASALILAARASCSAGVIASASSPVITLVSAPTSVAVSGVPGPPANSSVSPSSSAVVNGCIAPPWVMPLLTRSKVACFCSSFALDLVNKYVSPSFTLSLLFASARSIPCNISTVLPGFLLVNTVFKSSPVRRAVP